jgi:hypothetical protein
MRPFADRAGVGRRHGGLQAARAIHGHHVRNPVRVTFAGLYRPDVHVERASDDPAGRSGPVHDRTRVMPLFERYLCGPMIRVVEWLGRLVRPIQSGDSTCTCGKCSRPSSSPYSSPAAGACFPDGVGVGGVCGVCRRLAGGVAAGVSTAWCSRASSGGPGERAMTRLW